MLNFSTKVSDDTTERLFRCVDYLIDESGEREFPGQLLKAFLYVASREGCLQKELEEIGYSSSSASRNVHWLTDKHRLGKAGLNWLEIRDDKNNPKFNRVYLTLLGKKVLKQMKYHLITTRSSIDFMS